MWLRPLGFGEILDEIFRFYRRHFQLLLLLALVPVLPTLLVQLGAGQGSQFGFLASTLANLGSPPNVESQEALPQVNLGLLLGGYLLYLALIPFSAGLVPRAGLDLALGQRTGFWLALRGTARRYGGLMALTFLYLAVALPTVTCLLLPLSLWILVRWAVALPVMLAEGVGPIAAVSRSWHLTRRSWWRILGVLVVVFLIQYVAGSVVSVLGLPLALAVPFVPSFVRGLIVVVVSTLGGAMVAPLWQLCFVMLYMDLRVRVEHLDLWQLADQAVAAVAR
jgi:glycerophosphoryl diester phosphodiesterase family protein